MKERKGDRHGLLDWQVIDKITHVRLVRNISGHGHVLRPLLFAIFIHDLDGNVDGLISKFADKTIDGVYIEQGCEEGIQQVYLHGSRH